MATHSMLCAAAGAPTGELRAMDATAGAMSLAASAFSRQDEPGELNTVGARASGRIAPPTFAGQAARQPCRPSSSALPEGYVPIRETRDMALLGRWTPLDDAMSPCLPARVIAAMRRRRDLGDRDADAWLSLHARAYAGDPEAQRAFGRVCENGLHRAPADLQRAFFWYYRASLQGDEPARSSAERLMQCTKISSATLAEPTLLYPGQWRITAHPSERHSSASLFVLAEDGAVTGRLLGASLDARCAWTGIAEDPVPLIAASPDTRVHYHGGWAYDGIGNVLTIIFESTGSDARRWRSDHWQIELLGCRAGALFGRDRRMVAYTLEHQEPERRDA